MADVYTNSEKHVLLSNNVKLPILGLGMISPEFTLTNDFLNVQNSENKLYTTHFLVKKLVLLQE